MLSLERTPIQRLAHTSLRAGSDVWVKRDDTSAAPYGGNKPRKLALLLADARERERKTLLTVGAHGSHHVLATAIHGAALGFDVEAVLVPQSPNAHVEENLRLDVAFGARLHPAKGPLHAVFRLRRLLGELEREGRRPYFIAGGGSSAIGTVGYVRAAQELLAQIRAGEMPMPSRVICALGSGGTAAGLALGFALEGAAIPVIGARIVTPWLSNRFLLGRLLDETALLIASSSGEARRLGQAAKALLHIDTGALGAGYGIETAAGRAAMEVAREDGLTLDGTYTAKAFGALLAGAARTGPSPGAARGETILYWHTLSSRIPAPPGGVLPPAPEWWQAAPPAVNLSAG